MDATYPSAQPVETKIITVPAQVADEEIRIRNVFGWRLVNAAARNCPTGGTILGAGANSNGPGLGAARMRLNNVHLTDLTFQRPQDARTQRLAAFEATYDAAQDQPPTRLVPTSLLLAVGLSMVWMLAVSFLFDCLFDKQTPLILNLVSIPVGLNGGPLLAWRARSNQVSANKRAAAGRGRAIQEAQCAMDSIEMLAGVARKPSKPVVDLLRDQRKAH